MMPVILGGIVVLGVEGHGIGWWSVRGSVSTRRRGSSKCFWIWFVNVPVALFRFFFGGSGVGRERGEETRGKNKERGRGE